MMKIGIVGAAGRGGDLGSHLAVLGATVRAVCEVDAERAQGAKAKLSAETVFDDYPRMLDQAQLDAVIVATPMHLHVPQAIAALERGIHVLCEVPVGVSIDECRRLVEACAKSKAIFAMAENYTYTRPNLMVAALVKAGLFGDPYYAEGEYLHELKAYNEKTPWRRKWQTGIDGITYGTHSLGPILQWMGQRITRVCCEGAGAHYTDPRGKPYHQDCPVMLAKTTAGGLIKIRVDMTSDRPHAMTYYQLQGTDGVYESSRAHGEPDRVWLRALSREPRWTPLQQAMDHEALAGLTLPEGLRGPEQGGHGGGDFLVLRDFMQAVRGEMPFPVGLHEAMDMTLPGLASQQSIAEGGRWVDVPDSRLWGTPAPTRAQLHMIWPAARLNAPPTPRVAEGYVLRQFRDSDRDGHRTLMQKVQLGEWDDAAWDRIRPTILPSGIFVIQHSASGDIVATTMSHHRPTALHPEGGEVGWVAADPSHAGKGLGAAVVAAATERLIRAGYQRVYLSTDDFRLPAIKTYLKLGFEPLIYRDDMPERWAKVREQVGA